MYINVLARPVAVEQLIVNLFGFLLVFVFYLYSSNQLLFFINNAS
jgi:hypothetical protein